MVLAEDHLALGPMLGAPGADATLQRAPQPMPIAIGCMKAIAATARPIAFFPVRACAARNAGDAHKRHCRHSGMKSAA
jgi:hypothetical protein